MFIKTHCTVDWNSVSKSLVHQDSWHYGLEQCSGRAAVAIVSSKDCRGRVGCLFIRIHLALNGWFGRKQSMQILVGHGGAAGPRLQTLGARVAIPATESSKGCRGCGCAPSCRHLALVLHALSDLHA
jgi:hypothetical protein